MVVSTSALQGGRYTRIDTTAETEIVQMHGGGPFRIICLKQGEGGGLPECYGVTDNPTDKQLVRKGHLEYTCRRLEPLRAKESRFRRETELIGLPTECGDRQARRQICFRRNTLPLVNGSTAL